MESNFEKELETLINRYSKENDSDTPDFILARYLNECLNNFSAAIKDREQWYGREKHLEDIPIADLSDVVIGKCDEDNGQKNIFIGNATGRLLTGNSSTFIGRPAGRSNFSEEVQEAITKLQIAGDKLLEKLKY